MKKHILTLINNERTNIHITSKKGYSNCTAGAYDWCPSQSTDLAFCSGVNTYDKCTKLDYVACLQGATDLCSVDRCICVGAGEEDF